MDCNNGNQSMQYYGNNRYNANRGKAMYNNANRNNSCAFNRMENNAQSGYRGNMSSNDCGRNGNAMEQKKYDGCDKGNMPIDKMMPAMAFVPWQDWEDLYDMEKGLERGTIFAQLDKPYIGRPVK